jgi:ubiquinone/menaquinone biosynthesis C-methylase UbiE
VFRSGGPTLRELAVEALSSTERGYDLLAPKFDVTPFRTPDTVLDAVGAHLAPASPYAAGLDICCGTGAGMRMLHPLCSDRVVGVDFSRGMLDVGRRTLGHLSGGPALEWVRGDARTLPLARSFDIAVCFGALGHIPQADEDHFLRQVAAVLRPGGRFVIVSATMPAPWSPRRWLARGFNGAMHLRNALVSPPFVMYYLTFLLPGIASRLERLGFRVDTSRLAGSGPLSRLWVVNAVLT